MIRLSVFLWLGILQGTWHTSRYLLFSHFATSANKAQKSIGTPLPLREDPSHGDVRTGSPVLSYRSSLLRSWQLKTSGLSLQKDFTQHSDILQELMERVRDEYQEAVEEKVEGEIQIVNELYSELYRLASIRQAFMETSSINARVRHLRTFLYRLKKTRSGVLKH